MAALMVPLMMATLFSVIASQIGDITSRFTDVAAVVPIYLAWFIVMTGIGTLLGHATRLDRPRSFALTFSGATRSSLVVLPLALVATANAACDLTVELLVMPQVRARGPSPRHVPDCARRPPGFGQLQPAC